MKASGRRQIAIGMLSMLYIPIYADGTAPYDIDIADKNEVAGNIRKLAQLGRTERWQAAIERWARMTEQSTGPKDLRWAFLQGMIFAGHAL